MAEDTIAERARSVAEAFTVTGLTRLTIKDGDFELEIRRSSPYVAAIVDAARVPDEATIVETEPGLEPDAVGNEPDVVTSDLVGVLHLSRPQVNAGQQLEGDRELAFVEALGIRNPVRSRGPGRIAAVFVSDGQPVEYGQPLFAIER